MKCMSNFNIHSGHALQITLSTRYEQLFTYNKEKGDHMFEFIAKLYKIIIIAVAIVFILFILNI